MAARNQKEKSSLKNMRVYELVLIIAYYLK
jgi:hypothetical protein